MLKEMLKTFNTGMKVFSEERRRHFSKRLKELLDKEDALENAVYPNRSNIDIDLHRKEMVNFAIAYGAEFEEAMKNVQINNS